VAGKHESRGAGRPGENTWSARLAFLLRSRGFPDADFERHFTITDPITGRHHERKPDVVFSDGGVHIISAKVGERLEREAISTAINYVRDLAPVTNLAEVFAVTFPVGDEKFHFHALPLGGEDELSIVLDTLDEVADTIAGIVRGRIADLVARAEPVEEEARRILRYAALDLSNALIQVPESQLEEIFGGHDFFHSSMEGILKPADRRAALRLGPAYLFVNQILFYVLLSLAARRNGTPETYPDVAPSDRGSPARLRDVYFSAVRKKDYEPIYGPDVARHFSEARVGAAVEQLVTTLTRLAPKLTVPDIVGQVFQTLIPLDLRKPLGAHYTNPNAARLLAEMTVTTSRATVMDLACGSGTLLVAAYRRKWELSRSRENPQRLHKTFLETDLTGLDAMAFSCHLAAVNLALQQPLMETDYVRIGRVDSTLISPGTSIQPATGTIPTNLRQRSLEEAIAPKKGPRKLARIPSIREGAAKSFDAPRVDVILMNPPFTSQNNLAPGYRIQLRQRFQSPPAYREMVFWKTSEQVYFLLLADRFLNDGGTVGAVLPFTTFTGHAFHPLVRFLVANYSVSLICVGLGRSSFSEDTSLTECLFVAQKARPSPNHEFRFVTIDDSPTALTKSRISQVMGLVAAEESITGLGQARMVPQSELLPENSTLSSLFLESRRDYREARRRLGAVHRKYAHKLTTVQELFSRGVDFREVYHGDARPLRVGPKALLGSREDHGALRSTDRLVLTKSGHSRIEFSDRLAPGTRYTFPSADVKPCIRRFSYLPSIDISGKTDFIISTVSPDLERTMSAFYTEAESTGFLKRLRESGWARILEHGSARLNVAIRVNLAAPGTTLLAFFSSEPAFLAGAYGYNVVGLDSVDQEKLFALWFNSSMALIQLLDRATITEGTWIKLEQYTAAYVALPDPRLLSTADWNHVRTLWAQVAARRAPSLLQQLTSGELREEIDVGLLTLLGEKRDDAARLSAAMREGLASAITMLRQTMAGGVSEVEDP
jgi:hypothetical protein